MPSHHTAHPVLLTCAVQVRARVCVRARMRGGALAYKPITAHPACPPARTLSCMHACRVYEAVCLVSSVTVALKVYRLASCSALARLHLFREVTLHARLDHPHIVQFFAAFKVGCQPQRRRAARLLRPQAGRCTTAPSAVLGVLLCRLWGKPGAALASSSPGLGFWGGGGVWRDGQAGSPCCPPLQLVVP